QEIKQRRHRRNLPPAPTHHAEAMKHSYRDDWIRAEQDELHKLKELNTFEVVSRSQAETAPLPLKWVYTYKFNKAGYLTKFKARIYVRGDIQPVSGRDTYAATLAGRSFRVVIALAAKYNLNMIQYDLESAFPHTEIDEEVWVQFPPGYY